MFKNRTKVIQHLIDNATKYKWSFDIHSNSFEMFVDDTQFIVKNNGETALYDYDVVFVDECSTIDNRTMLRLLEKIGNRFIIIILSMKNIFLI